MYVHMYAYIYIVYVFTYMRESWRVSGCHVMWIGVYMWKLINLQIQYTSCYKLHKLIMLTCVFSPSVLNDYRNDIQSTNQKQLEIEIDVSVGEPIYSMSYVKPG